MTIRRPPGSSVTLPSGSFSRSGSATQHGDNGKQTIVKEAVAAWRRSRAEVFVPLTHRPGEAQVDFGQAEVTLDGQTTTVALFVMTLPYSDALFLCAFPRECTEAFLEGHVRAFNFFQPRPAADQLRQPQDRSGQDHRRSPSRKITDNFLRLKSHHLFEDHFFVESGDPTRKGHVETLVGYARRNFLVPVPAVHDGLESLN